MQFFQFFVSFSDFNIIICARVPAQHGRVHGARGLDEVRRQEPARRLPQLARLLRSADVTGQRARRRRHQQRHQTEFSGDSASATSVANVSARFIKFE